MVIGVNNFFCFYNNCVCTYEKQSIGGLFAHITFFDHCAVYNGLCLCGYSYVPFFWEKTK